MLVGMGELCDQVLLQSLPTVDWMLDLVLALEGGGLVGWWTPSVPASVGPEVGIKASNPGNLARANFPRPTTPAETPEVLTTSFEM